MKQSPSTRRLNEVARARVASILLLEVSDPRLSMVTVTGAEVSVDRSIAKIYVSCESGRYDEVQAGLESAKSRIRSLFGRGLDWRVTPELVFVIDRSVDQAQRIATALAEVPPTMSVPKDEFGYPRFDAGPASPEASGEE